MIDNSFFKYKPTTAFWKIHNLISKGLPKFGKDQQKVFVIQGGQGAGKTIAILMLIIDALFQKKQEISICSAELSKIKDTVLNDFIKILIDYNLYNQKHFNKSDSLYQIETGRFVEFLGLDKSDVGKGRRRSIVYINEANKITLNQYTDISARADIVILDYNPDGLFWGHDLITDFNFINLTYLDNEYLSPNEVSNILAYKSKGFKEDGSIKNEYWANKWNVYGLGQVGSVEGRIYYWNKIDLTDFLKIQATTYIGVDWGVVDPFAVVEVKYYDNKLYINEINYASENEIRMRLSSTENSQIATNDEEGLVSHLFKKWNIDKKLNIICDSNRPNKIISLRRSGWERAVAIGQKSKLLDRINNLQSLEIYYTNTSKNIEFEQMNYSYQKDKFGKTQEEPIDANNHSIDAISYVVDYLIKIGVIKII